VWNHDTPHENGVTYLRKRRVFLSYKAAINFEKRLKIFFA
jgi:hypothetical protein